MISTLSTRPGIHNFNIEANINTPSKPTYHPSNPRFQVSTLDLFLTKNLLPSTEIIPEFSSDHSPIYLELQNHPLASPRFYTKIDFLHLKFLLEISDFTYTPINYVAYIDAGIAGLTEKEQESQTLAKAQARSALNFIQTELKSFILQKRSEDVSTFIAEAEQHPNRCWKFIRALLFTKKCRRRSTFQEGEIRAASLKNSPTPSASSKTGKPMMVLVTAS